MSMIKELFAGFGYLLRGFRFLIGRPRLWPWAAMPTIVNLVLLVAMIAAFMHYYGDLYAWLAPHLGHLDIENPSTWYMHILDAIVWVLDLIFQLLIILMSIAILLIISYGLSFVVAAPFNDALSERVEIILTGEEAPPFALKKFMGDILRTVRIEIVKAAVLISIPIVLIVLNVLPGIGGVLYIALTFFFGAWDMGFSYADLPMGRKVIPLKDRIAFARSNKWALIGFGSAFIIPFFALVFAAPMVVGGTMLYLDKHNHASDAIQT